MNERLTDEQVEAVIEAINDAINKGPWDKSNFLKVIGKKLTEIRDDFIEQARLEGRENFRTDSQSKGNLSLKSGQQEIFVSLYAMDGVNLQSWERIIANLPRQIISRPIYASEEDIQSIIKTKENKNNEAYVAVYINQADILTLSSDKAQMDKLGKSLLSLKDKTITIENITRFVHVTGVYQVLGGKLIKKPV